MKAVTRLTHVVAVVLAILVLTPELAHADAAAPTDYRSTIVGVTPQIEGLDVTIEGGDSFVTLTAPEGADVIVYGYTGEPYLRFDSDGTISTNRLSAATYENRERYGATEVPAFVDSAAAPEWEQVATGRTWAWHDHRAHWMGDEPPIGLEPGGSLPLQTIPVTVDGRPVQITVETTLVGAPSWLPSAIGLLIGVQLVLLGWWIGPATATLTTILIAIAAVVTGAGQFLSLPRETGPLHMWWAMPTIALLAGLAAIATYGRSDLLVRGLLALSGLQLALWAFLRRSTFTTPVLPTDVPYWFDRATTGAALAGGTAVALLAIRSIMAGIGEQRPSADTGSVSPQ
jgi:hypothetical protein